MVHPGKKSWTAKLLKDEALLCSKVREEAGELCQSAEESEGRDRVASEMADLLYHSMVLLNAQVLSHCFPFPLSAHNLFRGCMLALWLFDNL